MHHWGIPRTEAQFCWQWRLKAGNSLSAPVPAAHSLRECVPETGVPWLGPKGGPVQAGSQGGLGMAHTEVMAQIQESHPASLLCPVFCAAGQPSLDVPLGWPQQPSYHISVKKAVHLLQVVVVRQLRRMAIQSLPVFRKECLLVSPYLCMAAELTAKYRLWASFAVIQGENLGGYYWTGPSRRIPEGFPRRERESLWDIELLK